MTSTERYKIIQIALGFEGRDVDGIPGPKTDSAYQAARLAVIDESRGTPPPSQANLVLRGDGTWKWQATVEGNDIVVRNATATWFGGDDDPIDSGETASGIKTKGNPGLMGAALPMDGFPTVRSTKGSPIPKIPWRTSIEVKANGKVATVPLIDIGPAKSAGDQIDLTQAAFKYFAGNLRQGVLKGVEFRVIGGAKYVAT